MHFPKVDWQVREWLAALPPPMSKQEIQEKPMPSTRVDPGADQKDGTGVIFLSATQSLSPLSSLPDQELGFFFLKLPQFEPIVLREMSASIVCE